MRVVSPAQSLAPTSPKVWTAKYSPFCGVTTQTGTPIALRFPDPWFQNESGLYQNWMRDYDPTTGRYIEADLLGLGLNRKRCRIRQQDPS